MKRLLALLLFSIHTAAFSQIVVTVSPADTILCYRDSIAIEAQVTGQEPYFFRWLKDGLEISSSNESVLIIPRMSYADTGAYQCIVNNDIGDIDTSDFALLHVHPQIVFDTLYRFNNLGCRVDCKGQYKVLVSGGLPPYTYDWNAGFSQDTLVFGLCPGTYKLEITDANNCRLDTNYFVDYLRIDTLSFQMKPPDTLYLTNPNLTASFRQDAAPMFTNWEWEFGDSAKVSNVNPVSHIYDRTGKFQVALNLTDLNGCDTTITDTIYVRVAKLKVPLVMTPNGDELNDKFQVIVEGKEKEFDYRQCYLGTELFVYDRWGGMVYSKKNYASGDWDAKGLSDGVYFYILKLDAQFEDEVIRGTLTILGSGSSE